MQTACVVPPSAVCLALPNFFNIIPLMARFSKKKDIKYELCVFIFSIILSETFLVLRRIKRDIIVNVHRSSLKVPIIFSDFN
jgi:hypothetical protein